MFAWYKHAAVCYVYLVDISGSDPGGTSIIGSRWSTRGWTLQELLAASLVEFYNQRWVKIARLPKAGSLRELDKHGWGDVRGDFMDVLETATQIPKMRLLCNDLTGVCVAEKMSWAANRETTRQEDEAYCLLGIFDVNLPLLYGEGRKAFQRLQGEIMRTSSDHTLFAWGLEPGEFFRGSGDLPGFLADSTAGFRRCGKLISRRGSTSALSHYSMTNMGVQIVLRHFEFGDEHYQCILVPLDCEFAETSGVLAVPLTKGEDGIHYRMNRHTPLRVSPSSFEDNGQASSFYISDRSQPRRRHLCKLVIEVPQVLKRGLSLMEVYPPYLDVCKHNSLDDTLPSGVREGWVFYLTEFAPIVAAGHLVIILYFSHVNLSPGFFLRISCAFTGFR